MPLSCTTDATGVTEGDAVCVTGWDAGNTRPIVSTATPANLGASRSVLGVAHDTKGATTLVSVLVPGDVAEQSRTSLSNGGLTSVITVDGNGRLTPLLRPNGSEFIVGTCDVNGHTSLQPRASLDTSPQHVFNVCAYGAASDIQTTTGGVSASNTAYVATAAAFASSDVGKAILIAGAGPRIVRN